jgi:YggT family protein
VLRIIAYLVELYVLAMFAYAIMSWVRIPWDSPWARVQRALGRVIDPVLAPVRRVIPPIGGFDLSFLVVLLVIEIVILPLLSR